MQRKHTGVCLAITLGLALLVALSLAFGPQPSRAQDGDATGAPRFPTGQASTDNAEGIVADTISYQGRLLDGGGNPVDGTRTLTFGLYAEASGGTPMWSETQYDVPLDDGYFHVQLAVDVELFDGQELWLGVQVQGDAQELEPLQPMLPAPYALSLRPGATVRGSGLEYPTLVIFSDDDTGLYVETSSGEPADAAIFADNKGDGAGAWVQSYNGYGLLAHSFNDTAVYAQSIETAGYFSSVQGHGVHGYTVTDDPVVAALKGQNDGLGPGVTGISISETGVHGESTHGHGVAGFSVNEVGVYGQSLNTAAFFTSTLSFGVDAHTLSPDPGVAAVLGNNHGAGPGVVGLSLEGFGLAGYSLDIGVYGESSYGHGLYGNSTQGTGVAGFSQEGPGVVGESELGRGGEFFSSTWTGVFGYTASDSPEDAGVKGQNFGSGYGVQGVSVGAEGGSFWSTHGTGVHGNTTSSNPEVAAVLGENHGAGPGVAGTSSDEPGVYGESTFGSGVAGFSTHGSGIHGESPDGDGVFGHSGDESGVHGESATGSGVKGIGYEGIGVEGLSVDGPGATFGSANGPAIFVEGAGTEGLRIMGAVGGDYILAGSDEDFDFKVSNIGDVFADGSYHCGQGPGSEPGTCVIQNSPADFAEMLPAAADLEPGDVLVITPDGKLARSTRAYQPTVVGAHSTQPGYLGGGQYQGQDGYAPLAITGIVPVKASTENGPIRPGDLLVASDTPGHAMRAGPNPPQGTVIGKALAGLDRGTGIVLMLAMLQ